MLFHLFLTEKDTTVFEKVMKQALNYPKKKLLTEYETLTGKADVRIDQAAVVFSTKMRSYIDTQRELYQEFMDLGKEIQEKGEKLSESFQSISKAFIKLGDL